MCAIRVYSCVIATVLHLQSCVGEIGVAVVKYDARLVVDNSNTKLSPTEDIQQFFLEVCKKKMNTMNVIDEADHAKKLLTCQDMESRNVLDHHKVESAKKNEGKKAGQSLRPYKKQYGVEVVNPHNFRFVNQPKACTAEEKLVISVHSALENFRLRTAIRNTYGNPALISRFLPRGLKTKLVFILGCPTDPSSDRQRSIQYELEMYADIVQVDYIDHYKNNTYKALYHLKWVSSLLGCPQADLIMKTDDDVLVNLRKLRGLMKQLNTFIRGPSRARLMIAGNVYMYGPSRDKDEKWYIPYEMYPYDTFPPWFQGMAYFLTPQLASRMYDLSFTTPYLFTDDVYIGILSDRVDGIVRVDLSSYYTFAYDSLETKIVRWTFDPAAFYHNPTLSDHYYLWYIHCNMERCA